MDKLVEIFADLFPDVDPIGEQALIDGGILDSFDIISLVAELDDAFHIEIPAEELTPENFNSLSGLYAMVRRLSE